MTRNALSPLVVAGTSRRISPLASAVLGLVASAAIASSSAQTSSLETAPVRLSVRKAIAGRTADDRTNAYAIPLTAGEYARVEIDHEPAELIVRVFRAGGIVDLEKRSAFGERRTIVELTSEEPATLTLRVEPAYSRAADTKYRIRLRQLRRGSDRDRLLYEARRDQAEAARLREAGGYAMARTHAERAVDILERIAEPDQAEVASALQSLGSIVYESGEYARADALYRRAEALARTLFGDDHPAVAEVRDHLAKNSIARGDYAEGQRLAEQALAAREKAFGSDHFLAATSMATLALAFYEQRDYARAGELSEKALETAGRTYGADTLPYQGLAIQTARVHTQLGNYDRARELLERAVAVAEKTAGNESPEVADSLAGLAYLYLLKRDNLKAQDVSLRALRLQEELLGPDHPRIADLLVGLGLLSLRSRDYEASKAYFLRAGRVTETALGPNHPSLARVFNNLGLVYWRQGDYAKAEEHYRRTLQICEAAFGPEHPSVAPALANLGILAKESGDYERAESHYRRALAILEKAHGPTSWQVAVPLESLGILYRDRGDYALAEPYFLRVLEIHVGNLGPDHPDVAKTLTNLAQLYLASGAPSRATEVLARRAAIEERNLPLQLAVGSERQKLAVIHPYDVNLEELISCHVNQHADDAAMRDLAATALLRRKGRVLDVMANSLGALRERSDAADRARFDELNTVTSKLATLVLNGPRDRSQAEHQSEIETLSAQRDRLEDELSRHTAGYFERGDAATLAAVKAAIPENAILVEFAVYRPFDPRAAVESTTQYGEPRYVAYVLSHGADVRWVDLGPEKTIDASIDALRRALRDPERGDPRAPARALDATIMQPIRAIAGDTERLLIAPDGQLHLIPFEALVDEAGHYLVERFAITYLSSGRDLLRMQAKRPSRSEPLVVADPSFGEPSVVQLAGGVPSRPKIATARRGITTGADLASVYFAPLTGTAYEARAIKSLFPEASVLTRSGASEAALKGAKAPEILHIATHGFFLGDAAAEGAPAETRAIRAKVAIENPLLRSGLALSGANLTEAGTDDGILTALEASSLDLWGTRLVTLSACDTGVGEVRNGEGVYGLRRAFFLAGTETLVMSLWPVSDSVTRKMMTAYYAGLKAGLGRGDALRQAQRAMLAQKGRRHPFYWAGFIQSGEWASLDGRR